MVRRTIKNRIKRIQNRLGVPPDGLIGPTTLTALENALFDDAEKESNTADYSLVVSRTALRQLLEHEISSYSYYKRFLSHPTWPGGASGITIGIGYDLGYNSPTRIRRDWGRRLPDLDVERLTNVSGLKAEKANQALGSVKSIAIPLETARAVFTESTLPRYAALTMKTYPGVDALFPDAQASLLSLIYNRGTSFKGSRRKEMAAIKPLVIQKDYQGIAEQIKAMKRLWEGKGLDGLLKRREAEATLLTIADRRYDETELVRV